ncbi:MAG: GntR family transcriptional regulator [Hoeflea sp.]|uniref:GntR family transcriptional regulator n=1 Tax=Hoeflea sp. TaxID=1940281 RepID=UPI003299438F|tara:strand:+ start:580 stop:1317 length:738 start_codon:yes stop_codon:yes gene_type:complete
MSEQRLPRYQTIHKEMLNRLSQGLYSVGTRLPSEDVLAKSFGVSRVTVRRSLEMLVNSGYLVSRQGSGYMVNTLSPPATTCMISFTDAILKSGRIPGARLIGVERFDGDAPASVQEMFGEPVTRIQRLRTVDSQPRMLVNTWVPTRSVPNLSPADFPEGGPDQSILRILIRRFGLEWGSACETIRPQLATDEVAELLGLPCNALILTQACSALDDTGAPVFYDEVYRDTPITYELVGASRQERNP